MRRGVRKVGDLIEALQFFMNALQCSYIDGNLKFELWPDARIAPVIRDVAAKSEIRVAGKLDWSLFPSLSMDVDSRGCIEAILGIR